MSGIILEGKIGAQEGRNVPFEHLFSFKTKSLSVFFTLLLRGKTEEGVPLLEMLAERLSRQGMFYRKGKNEKGGIEYRPVSGEEFEACIEGSLEEYITKP